MTLEIDVTASQAESMSQILKRIGFQDIRVLSYDDEEAYMAQYAFEQIRSALAECGFNPR